MRAVLDEYADRVLIGELYLPIDRLVAYYGRDGRGAQLPFNFQLLLMQGWDAATIAGIITQYEAALPTGGWPNWVLGNHDRPRIASRVGPAQARVAALLLLTLRGTPTIYMGDELGMVDTTIPPAQVRDPAELREPGKGLGRDGERTPFLWDTGPGAGFTTGTPWLPPGKDTPLSLQREDPGVHGQPVSRLAGFAAKDTGVDGRCHPKRLPRPGLCCRSSVRPIRAGLLCSRTQGLRRCPPRPVVRSCFRPMPIGWQSGSWGRSYCVEMKPSSSTCRIKLFDRGARPCPIPRAPLRTGQQA